MIKIQKDKPKDQEKAESKTQQNEKVEKIEKK